ncbi:hypothetical protein Tco_1107139 [Tanacetum coccineum]
MINYSLWEVIENGNTPPITKVVEGVETTIAPTTAEEKAQRRGWIKGLDRRHKVCIQLEDHVKNYLTRRCESEVLKKSVTRIEHTYHCVEEQA